MNMRYLQLQAAALVCLLLLSGCGATGDRSLSSEDSVPVQTAFPELENTDWLAVGTDAAAFDLEGGLDNPNVAYVFEHTDTVPLDQLIVFALTSDALNEGACEELRSRFLEAPNKILTYLVLMDAQQVEDWNAPAAEVICRLIASADAAWHDGSAEFAQTMETCRETYPKGPAAELLDVMEAEHEISLERNR